MNESSTTTQEQPYIDIVTFKYTNGYGYVCSNPGDQDGEYIRLVDHNAVVAKLRKQLEQVEAHSAKLQLASDDLYQGYIDELNHMSGWPELREEIEWFADNEFYK